jgi:hypothetical protein
VLRGTDTIRMNWGQPADNGALITAYEVRILNKGDQVYREVTSICDGKDPVVITT